MTYDFESISSIVCSLESPKRYKHTLGVFKEASALGEIFLPSKAEKLALAGLLHDITKDFNVDKHISLCEEYGVHVEKEGLVPKLLHSKTGCEYARRLFGESIIDDEIYSSILYHTTGKEGMSLFESIIYLADYIEEGRTFEDCVVLRKFFYDKINTANSYDEKLSVLRETMILSFDFTIRGLIEESKLIDYDTLSARNYFLKNKDVYKNISVEG